MPKAYMYKIEVWGKGDSLDSDGNQIAKEIELLSSDIDFG